MSLNREKNGIHCERAALERGVGIHAQQQGKGDHRGPDAETKVVLEECDSLFGFPIVFEEKVLVPSDTQNCHTPNTGLQLLQLCRNEVVLCSGQLGIRTLPPQQAEFKAWLCCVLAIGQSTSPFGDAISLHKKKKKERKKCISKKQATICNHTIIKIYFEKDTFLKRKHNIKMQSCLQHKNIIHCYSGDLTTQSHNFSHNFCL